jgi:hypothetical protein
MGHGPTEAEKAQGDQHREPRELPAELGGYVVSDTAHDLQKSEHQDKAKSVHYKFDNVENRP